MIEPSSKRIIFVPFIDAFGGAERLVLDLARFLKEIDLPHTIACFRQTIDLESYSDGPLDIHELLPKRNPFLEARSLKTFLKSIRIPETGRPLLFDLKSAFYCGLASSVPFVLHLTDPPSLLPADVSKYASSARQFEGFGQLPSASAATAMRAEMVHRLNRRGVRLASKVIAMTEKIQTELRSLYDVDAVVVAPGVSIRTSAFEPSKRESSTLRMLSVSRLEPNKRIDWILRALATINEPTIVDWKLEVVGDGTEMDSLKKLALDLSLGDRVVFLGHLTDHGLAAAYARANLFLMPAVQGYGLPALEALSRGIPTIVHRDSGVSETLRKNPWVEIVDGNNGSLTKAITIMFDRLKNGGYAGFGEPAVRTSSEWARKICIECGWLSHKAI